LPAITAERTEPHRFVPDGLDPTDPQAITRLYDELDKRDASTIEALEALILDWEELDAVVSEAFDEAYIDMTADTTNPDYEARYIKIVEQILPISDERSFALKQKILDSPAAARLDSDYDIFLRNMRSEVGLFRTENVPLLTEDRKMDQEYEKIVGSQRAEFRGKTYTLPQLAPFLEETDRKTREEAWRARAQARQADSDALDVLFDRMYEVRQQIARNAGFENFRDYKFEELKRFDYGPDDCLAFHTAIEKYVVPVVVKDQERRKRLLGVNTVRPWDLDVDPEGNPPYRPFDNVERLREGCERIFKQVDPELGGYFQQMIEQRLLDLENRPGKAPGGYMESLPDKRVPFIFMNAVGTKSDVDTLLHEGGHAFHYFLARRLPLHSYHHTGSEFAEVASMSMELLARPYLAEFYTPEELKRLRDNQLRSVLSFLPFMAMIDAFQHWVYTYADHGPKARRETWRELEQRFRPAIDWSGLEKYRDVGWQYLHVFTVPFYYVEYGIAQLAALRIWLNSLQDERDAVESYKRGLSLGGSRPLPELFNAAGAEFGMNDRTVRTIVEGTMRHIGAS
jgi:oligoendopeptidase F